MATLSQVRETLQLSTGASNLVQPVIDRFLFESVRKYTPLRRTLPRMTWRTNTFLFNQRTKYPVAQATTEAPPTSGTGSVGATSSVYNQVAYPIKHYQTNLDLAEFSIQIANVNGNLVDLELEGAAKAMVYLEEMLHMYGSAQASLNTLRPQWDGFDMLLATGNKLDSGAQVIDLAMLDSMIDQVKARLADELGNNYFFLVSPKMQSTVNRLFQQYERWFSKTTVFTRDDYGIPDAPVVDNGFDTGFEVVSYRSIPIIESSFLASIGTMGTVSAAASGTGSGLANSQYSYVVEVVTDYGVSVASPEVQITPSAGQNVTLSWSTPAITDAFGNTRPNLLFRIFRTTAGGASGSETLYAVVSALDNTDSAITSFVDTGNPYVPANNSTQYAVTVATSGSNAAPDSVTFPRIQSGSQVVEDIFLMPRTADILVVPAVNEMRTKLLAQINARTIQLALTADETLALRGPQFGSKLCRVRAA